MKTSIKIFIGLLIFSSIQSFAQTDAKVILSALSKKYKTNQVSKTSFILKVTQPQATVSETLNGSLFLKANENKFKLIFPSQELYSDGKNQWTYVKEDKEVQLTKPDRSNDDALNPANLFINWDKGYKYRYLGSAKVNGASVQNIELVPIQNRSYSKIKLSILKDKNQIKAMEVFGKDGSRYLYLIQKFEYLKEFNAANFAFQKSKYPDVELVDLR